MDYEENHKEIEMETSNQELNSNEEVISPTYSFPEENDILDYGKIFYFENVGYRLRRTPFSFASLFHFSFLLQDNFKRFLNEHIVPIKCARCHKKFTRDVRKYNFYCSGKNHNEKGKTSVSYFAIKAFLIDLYNHGRVQIQKEMSKDTTRNHYNLIFNDGKGNKVEIKFENPNETQKNNPDLYKLIEWGLNRKPQVFDKPILSLRDDIECDFDYIRRDENGDIIYSDLTDQEQNKKVIDILYEQCVPSNLKPSEPPKNILKEEEMKMILLLLLGLFIIFLNPGR